MTWHKPAEPDGDVKPPARTVECRFCGSWVSSGSMALPLPPPDQCPNCKRTGLGDTDANQES